MEFMIDLAFYFLLVVIVFLFYIQRDIIFNRLINMKQSRTRIIIGLGILSWGVLLFLKATNIMEVTWTRTPLMSLIIFIQLISVITVYFNVFKNSELHNGIKVTPILILIVSTVITTVHLLDTASYQLVKPGRYEECVIVDHTDESEQIYTDVTIHRSNIYNGDFILYLSYISDNGMTRTASYIETDIEVVCK